MTRSKRKTRLPLRFSSDDNDGSTHQNNTLAETEGTHTHPSSAGISVGDIGLTFKKKFHKVLYTGTVVRIRSGAGKTKCSIRQFYLIVE
jgi:hypothetical protein